MNINKSIFLKALFCETYSWRSRNEKKDDTGIDYETLFRTTEGKEIGVKAHNCFPGGYEITGSNIDKVLVETQKVLENKDNTVFFEAAFEGEEYVARPDVLIRGVGDTFEMIEVKSSLNVNAGHIDDMAYTAMVLHIAGMKIVKYVLMLISRDFRLGMKDDDLFVKIDQTENVKKRVIEFLCEKDRIRKSIQTDCDPKTSVFIECRKCEYLELCHRDYTGTDSIFSLPRFNDKMFKDLSALKIKSVQDIPDSYRLSEAQAFVKEGIAAGTLIKLKQLTSMLKQIEWPVYYLDFESMSTALPLYPDTAPYAKIPTQFSIHYSEGLGLAHRHFEYLSDSRRDCREELADALIQSLGESGAIFSYSAFEKTIINGLIDVFPNKKMKLKKIISRISDLQKIVECTYHPQYRGSYSIKKVLPALIPSLSYDDLEINNGSAAMCVFALMAKDLIDENLQKEIRKALLKYCERDTYAMIKLHEILSTL